MGKYFDGEFKLPEMEEKILAFWDAHGIFEKSLEQTADGVPFTFYDGPPFATGLPHYGHLLASTMKDLVPRYQTMNGRFVRRRWGWDCHGLPIEEVVERKLGISGKKQIEAIGIKTFNETCRSMVLQYASEWRSMIRRIARWVEFDDSYKTMDTDFMESVWWGFKNIYDKDLVYEGRKVLLYCPRCETPLSNFEVAMDNSYKDVQEESVYIKFPVKDPGKLGGSLAGKKVFLLAWTTTPWSLPGDVALAVNKTIDYHAIEHEGEIFIIAAARLKDLGFEGNAVAGRFTGKDLAGLSYEPVYEIPAANSDQSFKVYDADFVNTEDGTGIVHIATVHGEDDYALGLREDLPVVPLLDEKGMFNEDAPELVRGKYFKDADRLIKNDLEQRGFLFKRKQNIHSYPFCWRCGTMLYYNAIPAWFVNIQKIKPQLLESNEKEINWFPEHLKHGRYEKSVEAAPDWNISRNRFWGNPVPVWKCADCDSIEVVGGLEELAAKAGPSKNRYWVMRHGQSENLVRRILDSGDQHCKLTKTGREQVARGAEILKDAGIDIIYASDLDRTKETAEIVAKTIGVKKIIFDGRLHEVNVGPISGHSSSEYDNQFPRQIERFERRPVAGGESMRDVRARAWDLVREAEATHEGKNILLVSHEDVIWVIEQAALGWSDRQTAAKKKSYGVATIEPAEARPLEVKTLPRNDTGEADLHRPYIDEITFPCVNCKGTMRRTPEIFDSWIEAGSMPFAEYHFPFENKEVFKHSFPAQFVTEYIAQTRAWFYLMHVVSFILFGRAPFENVVTTGTVLAEDGTKMSKSKGNFPDPKLLLDKYGADSLRFYLMNSVVMQADNMNFLEKGVEGIYRKVGLLLVNVYKYFETYAGEVSAHGDASDMASVGVAERGNGDGAHVLDLWIGARTDELVGSVTRSFDSYDTVRATRAMQEYIDDLSTWYLRRSRKRTDAGFFITMRELLLTTSRVIAPVMPFLAEALYQELSHGGGPISVHLTEWPKTEGLVGDLKDMETKKLMEGMAEVRRLASATLARRAEAKIKLRQPLAALTIRDGGVIKNDERLLAILRDEVNVKEIRFDAALTNEIKLDIEITPALREEGVIRESTRMFQELRQKAKLSPRDRIVAMLEFPREAQAIIVKNEVAFKKEIGAKEVEYKHSDKFQAEEITKMDGEEAWAAIRKI